MKVGLLEAAAAVGYALGAGVSWAHARDPETEQLPVSEALICAVAWLPMVVLGLADEKRMAWQGRRMRAALLEHPSPGAVQLTLERDSLIRR